MRRSRARRDCANEGADVDVPRCIARVQRHQETLKALYTETKKLERTGDGFEMRLKFFVHRGTALSSDVNDICFRLETLANLHKAIARQ